MCTILLHWDPVATHPVIVAANRDEFRARPTDPPGRLAPGVFAGRDRRAGGTWLAVGLGGLAAVTNVSGLPTRPEARSRGELPFLALTGRLPPSYEEWNAFNLVIADAAGVRVVVHRGPDEPDALLVLEPGAHVVLNEPYGSEPSPRARHAAVMLGGHEPTFAMLADHGGPAGGLCHHGEDYGTVSATTVMLDHELAVARYLHADGQPCRVTPRDLTDEARAVTAA
jgi:hypothetical protein